MSAEVKAVAMLVAAALVILAVALLVGAALAPDGASFWRSCT